MSNILANNVNVLVKKLSAAAAVTVLASSVLGGAAASQGATIYSTGFEPTDGFVPGALSGQGNFTDLNGGATGTGTIVLGNAQSGLQSAQINSTDGGFSEFYSSSTAVSAASVNGGSLTVSFGLQRATPTGNQSTGGLPQGGSGDAEAGFGVEVLDSTESNVLASVFVRNTAPLTSPTVQASVPALFVTDAAAANGSPQTEIFGGAGTAASDGTYGTYSLTMNFSTGKFTVTSAGGTSTSYFFAVPYDGTGIGAVTLSATNEGNNTAYFDNFSVSAFSAVPEPVSIGMVCMGSLLMMGRRRKEPAI